MADQHEPRKLDADDLLSAYLDDELAPGDRARLKERLAAEPELGRRLELLRQADRAVRQAYAPIVDEPLPAALLNLLATEEVRPPPRVVPLDRAVRRRERRPAHWSRYTMPRAIAAGIALAIGVTLGLSIAVRDGDPGTGPLTAAMLITPDRDLYDVLETVPSDTVAELSDRRSAAPRLSFKSRAGSYCRELGLADEDGTSTLVVCRETGGWRLEAIARTQTPAASPDSDFVPASGNATELDSVIAGLIDGAPLGPTEERQAIGTGWR